MLVIWAKVRVKLMELLGILKKINLLARNLLLDLRSSL